MWWGCLFVQAASFGGTNIDPTAWEDKKCAGESRFPAQVSFSLQPVRLQYGASAVKSRDETVDLDGPVPMAAASIQHQSFMF